MDGTLALAPSGYEPPALQWREETAVEAPGIWFVILVGFSYSAALAWASYCIYKGGSPEISFGWSGFKVACYR